MIVVTGGEGFIGTNLVRALKLADHDVQVLERGDHVDILPPKTNTVVHLAAHADVRSGWHDPRRDVRENLLLTHDVLETLRFYEVRNLVFASSGSVYHSADHFHTERCEVQATSLYAASKIACEQLMAAYAAAGHFNVTVLRFVSVLGPHYSHGLIIDFVRKLQKDPTILEVLAPGTSRKSYVHVADVIRAITDVIDHPREGFNIYNVGTPGVATPVDIGKWVIEAMGLDAHIKLVGETWTGDNPTIRLNTAHLHAHYGWMPQNSILGAVKDTVQWLMS